MLMGGGSKSWLAHFNICHSTACDVEIPCICTDHPLILHISYWLSVKIAIFFGCLLFHQLTHLMQLQALQSLPEQQEE